jgi:hypothetical protein
VTAASVSAFAPTILTELGWTSRRAQVMTIPIWVVGIVATFSVTWVANRVNCRFPFLLAVICLQLVGWSIMRAYVPLAGVRYAALFFMSAGTFPQMAISMGWLAVNLRGRKKLAVGMAWMVGFGNCANFVSSNIFITSERPFYPTGFTTGLAFTALGFIIVCLSATVFTILNKKRDSRRLNMSKSEKDADDETSYRYAI